MPMAALTDAAITDAILPRRSICAFGITAAFGITGSLDTGRPDGSIQKAEELLYDPADACPDSRDMEIRNR